MDEPTHEAGHLRQTGPGDDEADGGRPEVAGGDGPAGPRRVAGAWVVLVDGRLALYVAPASRRLLTFGTLHAADGARLGAAIATLAGLPPKLRARRLRIEQIDGRPAAESPLFEALLRLGFERTYRGLAYSRR